MHQPHAAGSLGCCHTAETAGTAEVHPASDKELPCPQPETKGLLIEDVHEVFAAHW